MKKSKLFKNFVLGFVVFTSIITTASLSNVLTNNLKTNRTNDILSKELFTKTTNNQTNSLSNSEISSKLASFSKNTYKNSYINNNESLINQETLMTNAARKLQFRAQNWLMQQGNDRKYYSSLLNSVKGITTLSFNDINLENELNKLIENAVKSVWPTYTPTDITKYFFKCNPEPDGGAGYTNLLMNGYKQVPKPTNDLWPGNNQINDQTYFYDASIDKCYLVGNANDCWGKTLYNSLSKSVVNIGRQTVHGNGLIDDWAGGLGCKLDNDDLIQCTNDVKTQIEKECFKLKNNSLELNSLFFKNNNDFSYSLSSVWEDNYNWRFKLYDNTDNNYFKQSQWNNLYGSMKYTNLNKWFPENRNTYTEWFGNQNTINRLDKIIIDFSKLIEIDLEKTSKYFSDNESVHKTSPKVYFGWNIELLNAINEAYELSNIALAFYNYLNVQNNIENIEPYKLQALDFIRAIYNQTVSLTQAQQYIEQIKTENSNWYFSYQNNKKTWAKTLDKYNWNFNFVPENNVNKNNLINIMNQILNFKVLFEYALPIVFNNDIYCEIKSTGNNNWVNEKSMTQIFNANTKSFIPISIPNYGYQQEHYNNDIEIEIRNIYMYNNSTSTRIAGYNTNNDTLNTQNIFNETNINPKKIKYISYDNSNNAIKFKFAYNPNLQDINKVPIDQQLKTVADFNGYTSSYILCEVQTDPITRFSLADKIMLAFGLITEQELRDNPELALERFDEFVYTFDNNFKSVIINYENPKWINYPDLINFSKCINIMLDKQYDYKHQLISESEFLTSRKELDLLNYAYITLNTKIPLDYFLKPNLYKQLIDEQSIIVNKDADLPANIHQYFIKVKFNYTPLEIEQLDQYLTINYSNSLKQISDIRDINTKIKNYETDLFNIQKQFISSKDNFKQIQQSITDLDKWATSELEIYLNQNPDLKQQYLNLLKEYDDAINALNTTLNKNYKDFENNKNWVANGFIEEINKTFNYLNDLEQYKNLITNKIQSLTNLFNNPLFDKFKSDLNTKLIKIKNDLQYLTNSISDAINQTNTIKQDINNRIEFLKSIKYLEYEDNLVFTFNTNKMFNDSHNLDTHSLYWIAEQNNINKYFYVTKNDFVTKLNNLIASKYNFDPNIKTNEFFGYDFEKPFEVYSNLNSIGEGTIYTFGYNQTPQEIEDCLINTYIFKYIIRKSSNINLQDEINNKAISNQILSQKELLKQAKTLLKQTLDVAKKNIELADLNVSRLNDLKNDCNRQLEILNKQSSNFIPNGEQLYKQLDEINNKIANYQAINVYEQRINGLALGLTIGFSCLGVILLIGLILFIKSKQKPKFKTVSAEDNSAMDNFINRQGENE